MDLLCAIMKRMNKYIEGVTIMNGTNVGQPPISPNFEAAFSDMFEEIHYLKLRQCLFNRPTVPDFFCYFAVTSA